jgi:uncharacterized protein YrzB (UPF0473 family)
MAASINEIHDPIDKGLAIANRSYENDSGFDDFYAELTIIQKEKTGKEEAFQIRLWGLENKDDGDKSISVYDFPPDVKGMARLSHSHMIKPDDHWVYIPENKRVRRVSPTSQLSYFMGTQFTFEDLRLYRAESSAKYSFLYLKDDILDEIECYQIQRFPYKKKFTNYSSQIMWIDKEAFRVLKIEFYDLEGELVKTLVRSDFKLYEGKFWAMQKMAMTNNQTGENTLVLWNNYRFGMGLSKHHFSRENLKRLK